MAGALNRGFAYRARLSSGEEITGTLNAADADAARHSLESMQLQVAQLWPAGPAIRGQPLSAQDLKTFNQQLAMLVKAGLPVESGLRLLGSEMGRGRLARAMDGVAHDLESGLSLPQAIAKSKGRFPADYGPLLEAGVKSHNLAAVLMNLGFHVDLSEKLREALRRALAYPLFVFIAMLGVLSLLGLFVLPRYQQMYGQLVRTWRRSAVQYNFVNGRFQARVLSFPTSTRMLMTVGQYTPQILMALGALVVAALIFWIVFRHRRLMLHLRDAAALHLPLLGVALRQQLLARWIHGLKIGIDAGLDLPAAIELAGAIAGSPALQADGRQMARSLSLGLELDQTPRGNMLPKIVPATLQLAVKQNNLSDTAGTLAQSFRRQAEHRTAVIPAVLSPVLLLLLAVTVGFVIYAMLAPLIGLLKIMEMYTFLR